MPPNNIEFAQVVNTNNEVNLNTITNNLGSNSSNFLVVPTISQQSSSSSFFNSITNPTSYNISTSSSQQNFNTLVNFSSPNSPQNSITSAASLHESDECEFDLQMDDELSSMNRNHAQIVDDMGGVFDDIIKGSFDTTDLAATSIPIMSSNNLNSSSSVAVGAATTSASGAGGFPTANSIKQEMRYMNEDDACTTNSSSMSCSSNNEKLVSLN